MKYTLSDEVIAAVARCLQLSMLSNTDVVDHLRLLEVEPDPADVTPSVGQTSQALVLTAEGKERFERNIQDLNQQGQRLRAQMLDGSKN